MPGVPAAITAALVSSGVSAALAASISSLIVSTAISTVFNFIAGALTKKDKPDTGSFASIKSLGASQQFRQAITERRIVYGECRVSGPIVFPAVTDDNKYLHFVIVLASHEIEEIGEIQIEEETITDDMLDSDGLVISGFYDGKVRIKKHLGSPTQTADADLVSEVPEWTTNHRLRNCAYIYIRYEWDRDIFPTGIPNASAWVKGKKCYDPRDTVTKWTPNIALQTRDYISDSRLGLKVDNTFINDTATQASVNICEEFVSTQNLDVDFISVNTTDDIVTLDGDRLTYQTGDRIRLVAGTIGGLSGGTDYYVIPYQRKGTPRIKIASSLANAVAGTAIDLTSGTTGTLRKIAEPRYFGGGVIKTSAERGNNLEEIITGMAGQVVYSGGSWRILAGAYQTPTIYFDEDDIVGPIKVSTKVSKSERFNQVQGVYISPLNDGNPADYPIIENSTYQTQDGEPIKTNLDLGFTQRPHTAQRIAKIALERMRQEIIFEASFKLTAMKVQVGDNFFLSFDRYGWSNKIFEVIDWTLGSEDDRPVVIIKARENASAVYDWNNGEETYVDPAPNTDLANPFIVPVVLGFSLDSIVVQTKELDRVFSVVASWDLSDDQFVVSGGKYEVQFKETTLSAYNSAGVVDGTVDNLILPALKPDVLYDIRIFAYNSLGVRSAAVEINNFQVGSTITTDTEDWENETNARDGDDWENDSLLSEDWEI